VRPAEPAVAHHLDAYSYRLVVTRRLYDRSTQTLASPSFGGLVEEASLGVHPLELARLGVAAGERLRVRSAAGEIQVPVHPDAGLPRNVVSIPGRVADHGDALELLDSAELATDVRLETI
jgi:anaerobic selenocysteine-containing dehydrogenase